MTSTTNNTEPGARVYKPWLLKIYDLYVLGLSNQFFWKCPSRKLLEMYRNCGAKHLDIGVGTGWYLANASLPLGTKITLLDLNVNALEFARQRIAQYHPQIVQADALQPLPLQNEQFDSVSLMYLLHCLPGTIESKSVLLKEAARALRPGGVLFGATITGADFQGNLPARKLMKIYNQRGIFGNWKDDPRILEQYLRQHFREVKMGKIGAVSTFQATK